ncbi:MAG: MMPL family transporter [Proteobacteria bacterium]|nr:MMPL family transporter [Pseudomonadota bacterium]MBU4011034.1 MMPL family transporter [Pseudomonadota bacterium]MBU4035447.1 MMPL family transporter [Pseudomonadota bacterium]
MDDKDHKWKNNISNKRYGGLQEVLDRMFVPLARWCVEHSVKVLVGLLILTAVALYFASTVTQDSSATSFFDPADPAYVHYKAYMREFNSDEVTYIVYKGTSNKDGIFDPVIMEKIDKLTRAIELEVPFVRKVTSLSNVELIEAKGDDILIHRLSDNKSFDKTDLKDLRDITTTNPLYVGSLVTKDARYGAIIVKMTLAMTDPVEKLRLDPKGGDGLANLYPQATDNKINEILSRPEFAGIDFMQTGDVPWNASYNTYIDEDITVITLATLVLVAILCMLLFRSRLLGLFAPLGIVLLGILMTLAVMGALKYQINLMFLMLPTLICAIGVAQSVHLLMNWQNEYALSGSPRDAARITLEKIATPSLLCALTSAAGVAGMGVSSLKAMRQFGIYAALGIILTFAISLIMMTSLAAMAKKNPAKSKAPHPLWLEKSIFAFLETALKYPKSVLSLAIIATIIACAGLFKLKADYNFVEEYKTSAKWRIDTEKIDKIMGGTLSVVYVFDTGKIDGIQNPELIRSIESVQQFAKTQAVVSNAYSIVDYLKDLNRAFHGGDPAYNVIPKDRSALAQLLLVYELAGGKDMDDIRNIDRSKTVLELRVRMGGASKIRDLVNKIDAYIAAHPVPGAKVELSGVGLLWVKLVDYIAENQISGASSSFILILGFIVIAFGSLRLGLWAMIPNVLPFIFVMGFMGYMGWHLDYMRMMLASVTMGISVDDTIHFIARLRVVFNEKGNYRESLRKTMHEVGIPLVITSTALVVAFSSYFLSDFLILSSFGVLLCLSVIVGMLVELLLTPTIMVIFKPFGPELKPDTGVEKQHS